MARVAVLTHVKESTIVEPASVTHVGPRMPWSGGKLVTNKEEALRKFLARKPQTTATLTPEQIKILEIASNKTDSHESKSKKHRGHQSKHDVIHKITPTSKRMAHRAHVKVQGSSHVHKKALVVNGRIVGPRVGATIVKANAARGPKPPATTNKKSYSKKGIESSSSSSSRPSDTGLALQDKLGMSLDALVKRNGSK